MSAFRKLTEIEEREQRHKIYGVVVGVVTNITQKDDDSQGHRIKVKFPWLPNSDNEDSDWARCVSMGAGKNRGTFWLPEVGDEVLVAFEHGDIARPYILGTLWNGTDAAIYDNKNGKNDYRAIKTRAGHLLEFFDNKDSPDDGKITLKTKRGAYAIFDDKDKKITLQDHAGDNKVVIDQQNKKIQLTSDSGDIELKAKGTIKLDCETLTSKSGKNSTFEVGQNFEMKASSNMTIKASGTGDIESSGAMTIKGSKVNIN